MGLESPSHWFPPSMWQYDFRRRMYHKSHLQAWINCPWKFKREYVDSALADSMLRRNNFLIGTIMHMTSEKFWDRVRYDVTNTLVNKLWKCNTENQAFANIQEYMRDIAADIVPPGGWGPNIIMYTENLSRFEAMRWMTLLKLSKTIIDDPVSYWIPQFTEIKVTDETLRRTGKLDRIEKIVGRNTYAIVEIKAKIGYNISNIRRELAWYYLLAQRAWEDGKIDKQITHWGCIGYKRSETFFEEVKRRSITAMEKRFKTFQAAIVKDEYKKKRGYLCMWCEYAGECYADINGWQERVEYDKKDEYWEDEHEERSYWQGRG